MDSHSSTNSNTPQPADGTVIPYQRHIRLMHSLALRLKLIYPHSYAVNLLVVDPHYLLEHQNIDVIVIGPDVEDPEMAELHLKRACVKLQPGFKFADLAWELSCLGGNAPATSQ